MSESASGEADSSNDGENKEFVCPTCGEGGFDSKTGMKIHHSKKHGESLAHTTQCDNCGKEFQRKKSVERENENNFCGNECRGEWLSRSMVGENNHNYVQPITSECDNCGGMFEHKPHEGERYCSRTCRDGDKGGENCNFWDGGKVTLNCESCGDEFEVYRSQADQRKHCSRECSRNRFTLKCDYCSSEFEVTKSQMERRRCCSTECWHKLRSNLPPKEQPNYKGGYVEYYGPNWNKQRKLALERDNYTCQRCGDSTEDIGHNPSVHHLKRIKWYKNKYDAPAWYEKANRLENLISLCRSCHHMWEGIPLRPDTGPE